jgi:environmental stress-induced protein Ves
MFTIRVAASPLDERVQRIVIACRLAVEALSTRTLITAAQFAQVLSDREQIGHIGEQTGACFVLMYTCLQCHMSRRVYDKNASASTHTT